MFNKKVWASGSTERKNVLKHYVATTNRTGDLRATRGKDLKMEALVHDTFGSYPLHLGGILGALPAAWWWRPSKLIDDSPDSAFLSSP
jgi:hypothetical protein